MATYLTENITSTVESSIESIVHARTNLLEETGVDLLSNDTISNIMIQKIVKSYDPDFEVNMSRNGEDAKTIGISDVEIKCAKLKPLKNGTYSLTKYMFHANAVYDSHDSYIFATRDNKTLKVLSLYDIRMPKNVEIVEIELVRLGDEWYKKGNGKTKYDGVFIEEKFLKENISMSFEVVDGVEVFKDYE